jgi:CsoR family transcriptional regulator, copper-sensing transcriptional repressor
MCSAGAAVASEFVAPITLIPIPWRGRIVNRTLRGDTEGAMATQTRGYTATKDQLIERLAKIEGQVRGVAKMVEQDRYCIDVVTQINAVGAALDKVGLGLLDGHVRHCLIGGHGGPSDPDEQAQELMGAVGRMLSR